MVVDCFVECYCVVVDFVFVCFVDLYYVDCLFVLFLIDKVLYELCYEVVNWFDWLSVLVGGFVVLVDCLFGDGVLFDDGGNL